MGRDFSGHSHVGESAVEERAYPEQAAIDEIAGGSNRTDFAALHGIEGKLRGMDEISQFVT
jgi:hypothetical protein